MEGNAKGLKKEAGLQVREIQVMIFFELLYAVVFHQSSAFYR